MQNTILAATYNCSDSTSNAYGASNYGSCETTTAGVGASTSTAQSVPGAPNTGFMHEIMTGGSLFILVPVAIALIIVAVSSFIVRRQKHLHR